MGKGSSPRPFAIKPDEFARNWDSIFRKDAGAKDGPTIEGDVVAASEGLIDGEVLRLRPD